MDTEGSGNGNEYGDIPARPMRVKILYSFDAEDKAKCLARLPNTLQIPTVSLDENTQVGVIELQQCVQAIVTASPEIVSRLSDGDFTMYAYDYSEQDVPLVGQGMLSKALATAAMNDGTEKPMITGRICKNLPAVFSGGVKETLEVKLRFAPMSKPAATVIKKSTSPATSAGFDPNAWNASLHRSHMQQQADSFFDFSSASQTTNGDGVPSLDEILGLGAASTEDGDGQAYFAGVGVAETPTDSAFAPNPAFSHSAPGSRAASPMMDSDSSTFNDRLRHHSFSINTSNFADHSRPDSRASIRSEVQFYRHQRQASTQSLPQQELQPQRDANFDDEGQSRKRAKVTQTEWRGRSSFGTRSGDLRVTAAAAHSVQMHRPVARRPGTSVGDLEPPPRVPTPVPQRNPLWRHQRRSQPTGSRSFLRQASSAESEPGSDAEQQLDEPVSSSDGDSPNNSITAEGTPIDLPSSPPVFTALNQPLPSSPGLPTLPAPRLADSGYMSERGLNRGSHSDCLMDEEDRSPDAHDLEIATQYRARSSRKQPIINSEGLAPESHSVLRSDLSMSEMSFNLETPGDMNQLPDRMLLNVPSRKQRQSVQGVKPPKAGFPTTAVDSVNTVELSTSANASRRGSLALPINPSYSDPSQAQKRRPIKRARSDAPGSEMGSPAPSDTEGRPSGSARSGSGAQRRVLIQQRLEASLARNEMPQFCSHCGAIETATWRRMYIKHCKGQPSPLDSVEGEGETVGIEILEQNPLSGEVTRFLIRKSIKKTKVSQPGADFTSVTVCNPCGLWFTNHRVMRPQDKWHKKQGTRRRRRRDSPSNDAVTTDGVEPQSDAFFTDQIEPDDRNDIQQLGIPQQTDGADDDSTMRQSHRQRPRASSLQAQPRRRSRDGMNASELNAALTRTVQSSPLRFDGSQESPIEVVDLTPRPTRRLLFPSPRGEGEVKSLDDNGQTSLHATSPLAKASASKPHISPKVDMDGVTDVNVFEAFTFDKENLAPGVDLDEDLMHLFEGSPTAVFKTPSKTPRKRIMSPVSQRHYSHLLKTPTPLRSTRKPLSPSENAANNARVTDFMTSPSSSRYFLRSTPSRQARTPGRASQGSGSRGEEIADQLTPFSRHLALILSDANETAPFTSPSRGFDFSDMPTFSTPSRNLAEMDWTNIDVEFATFDAEAGGRNEAAQKGAQHRSGA